MNTSILQNLPSELKRMSSFLDLGSELRKWIERCGFSGQNGSSGVRVDQVDRMEQKWI